MMKLTYVISDNMDPYENLALEEYLLRDTQEDECILYLWQNAKTTVIGYNQNAWKECKVEELKQDGGKLARRLSGGGAVFHDMGNLNFTFLVRKQYYSVEKQTEVILKAANAFGIPAERTGRNDIVVEGKKFSGNAFYLKDGYCYHHGTILIDTDKEMMSRYLNASLKKLQSKGVASVKSRVCNLNEYAQTMTIETMKSELIKAFGSVYEGVPNAIDLARIDKAKINEIKDRLSSWEWIYGREIPFNTQWDHRFDWGEIQLQFTVEKGMIEELLVWTDAMEVELSKQLESCWKGVRFSKEDMLAALENESQSLVDRMKEMLELYIS